MLLVKRETNKKEIEKKEKEREKSLKNEKERRNQEEIIRKEEQIEQTIMIEENKQEEKINEIKKEERINQKEEISMKEESIDQKEETSKKEESINQKEAEEKNNEKEESNYETEKEEQKAEETKNKFNLWYELEDLEKIYIEWKEILKSIEQNKDRKWNIQSLQEIDKELLKEMNKLVDDKIEEFAKELEKEELEQNEIDMIRIKYAIFRNKSSKYLVEEVLDNQRYIARTSDKNQLSEIRKTFSNLRRAALRLGIIEKEEYQNNKLDIDIIKANAESKANKNKINTLIKIHIGEDVTIRYGNNKFSITKKQMKEINKYDENKILEELRKGDFTIIDEEAIRECFNNEIIEPLVIYAIMKSKGIKSFEQAQILNKYFKDGLDVVEDIKCESRTTVIVDLKGLQNSKITSKVKNDIIERAKKLADYNLVKIQTEQKPDVWGKIGNIYKVKYKKVK